MFYAGNYLLPLEEEIQGSSHCHLDGRLTERAICFFLIVLSIELAGEKNQFSE